MNPPDLLRGASIIPPVKLPFILSGLLLMTLLSQAVAQNQQTNIPYTDSAQEQQVLDVYWPQGARRLPVIFWIHGGGWQSGDKGDVHIKPQVFCERGHVFVSTNYRLLPQVDMGELIRDVALALGWVHRNIERYGGDPQHIIVMGHSAGAQLAALMCIDQRYLGEVQVPMQVLTGCVPIDGDTFDLPPIIMTAEFRALVYGQPQPTFGHRQKFGNDPQKHVDFSAVTHIARGKSIPPFLILCVAGHPDTTAQAQRLHGALRAADVDSTVLAAPETTHRQLNANLGTEGDLATQELFKFLDSLRQKQR
ncbi:MAG: alpha/beta hydrolase [Pirellulaceae bacterium]|nr:alpha/beta hydrolase [Pirellulaceae bacterium]